MLKREIDDKFTAVILGLEEAIFEYEELIKELAEHKKDLEAAKELAQSSRDLCLTVIASINGKKKPRNIK